MLYHLYSGHLWFSALASFVVVVALGLGGAFDRSRVMQSAARITALLALALAAFSATPAPAWIAVPGVLSAGIHLVASRDAATRGWKVAGVVAVALALVAIAWESRFHIGGGELQRPVRIVVLGDSLSSGGFGETRPWPVVLGASAEIDVVNLARPGDTVPLALEGQVPGVGPAVDRELVIVELGGNDMLEGVPAQRFEQDLESLSGRLASDGREVLMFELPLLPGAWGYGAAQRRVAARYGIHLVPKRVLAEVLLEPASTFDGLHLTQSGHDALASAVKEWAGW